MIHFYFCRNHSSSNRQWFFSNEYLDTNPPHICDFVPVWSMDILFLRVKEEYTSWSSFFVLSHRKFLSSLSSYPNLSIRNS